MGGLYAFGIVAERSATNAIKRQFISPMANKVIVTLNSVRRCNASDCFRRWFLRKQPQCKGSPPLMRAFCMSSLSPVN
jgi:hypothetical protein